MRGSPCYMAPELFQNFPPHSFASDIWAFGCTLYEMATGRPPFISGCLRELLSLIIESQPEEIVGTLQRRMLSIFDGLLALP